MLASPIQRAVPRRRRIVVPAAAVLLMFSATPGFPQASSSLSAISPSVRPQVEGVQPGPAPPEPLIHQFKLPSGPVTLTADHLSGVLGAEGEWLATGHVVLIRGPAALHADLLKFQPASGDVQLEGSVRLELPEGILSASRAQYNLQTHAAAGSQLFADVEGISIRAAQFYTVPASIPGLPATLIATDGAVTSCTFDHPDYLISARKIILQPGRMLGLNGASVSLFGVRIITVPTIRFPLGRKGKQSSGAILPSFGVSSVAGPFIRFSLGSSLPGATSALWTVIASRRLGLSGGVQLNDIAGSPWAAVIDHHHEIPRLNRPRLTIDRLPEISRLFSGERPAAKGLIDFSGEFVLGHYREYGSDVDQSRILGREAAFWSPANAASYPLLGIGLSEAYYGRTGYILPGVAVGYDSQLHLNLRGLVLLRFNGSIGRTPFDFDRLDARTTVDANVDSTGTGWGWSLHTSYDLGSNRLYDATVTIAHTLKCIRPSIGYRVRNRELLFGVTIPALEGFQPARGRRTVPTMTWNEGEPLPAVNP